MAEDLKLAAGTKQEQYESLVPQIKGLIEGETDLIADLFLCGCMQPGPGTGLTPIHLF